MRYFDPWIGQRYQAESSFGVRILILGESHYDSAENLRATYTIDVIRDIGQARRFRFFTLVQKLLTGEEGWVPDSARASFWEEVAFCNFVQCFPGRTARIRPTTEMWAAGRESLIQTVEQLAPQLIIVLGKELRGHIPTLPPTVHVCYIPHPSGGGFRLAEWRPIVKAAIKTAVECT